MAASRCAPLLCCLLSLCPPSLAAAAPPRPELLQDPEFLQRARQRSEGARAFRAAARSAAAAAAAPKHLTTSGTLRPLVLLMDFPDRPHNPQGHEPSDYGAVGSGILFGWNGPPTPNTVREYFDEVSYGALTVDGDTASIAAWTRLATPLATYVGTDQGYTFGGQLVADAVAAVDGAVDFGQFDNDGPDGVPNSGDDDGYVDALMVIHAGWGWEDSGRPQDLASHYATTQIATVDARHGGGTIRIADYVLVPEESYKLDQVVNEEDPPVDNGNEPLAEIGVYAHELGHILGLPDLYDTTFESYGVGNYCLMGYGLWGANYPQPIEDNRINNSPTHLSPWAKWKLGWLEPTPVWTDGFAFDLQRVEDAVAPQALVLYADSRGTEYFLVEHRASIGFDLTFSSYSQGGLVLWHVDEAALAAGGPTPNDDWTRKGVDVVCASGVDAAGRDDLDNRRNYASTAHWYFAPRYLPAADQRPGLADSRTNLGQETGITLGGLSVASFGDYPTAPEARMTGTASAGAVVLDPETLAAAPADHALDLSWGLSRSADVAGYRVYFAQGTDTEAAAEAGDAAATSFRLAGLADHATYRLRLVAFDGDGNQSAGITATAATLDTRPDTTPPTAAADPTGRLSRTPVTVTLSLSEPGSLYYTLDGSAPTTGSARYADPLTIAQTVTLRFLGVDAAGNPSPPYTETYTIDAVAPTAAATPAGRPFSPPLSVSLAANEPATIRYTLDGTTPTSSSPAYTGPVAIAATATLKFRAWDEAGNVGLVYSERYTLDAIAPTASASPGGGLSRTPVEVALSLSEAGRLHYTVDGSAPTPGSPAYSAPLTITQTTTLRFLAVDEAGNESPVYEEVYTIDAVPPAVAAAPAGRTFSTPLAVALTSDEPATIRYTLDGSEPTESAAVYTAPLSVEATTTVKFFGVDEAGNASATVTEEYVLEPAPKDGGGGGGGCFVAAAPRGAEWTARGLFVGLLVAGGLRRRRKKS